MDRRSAPPRPACSSPLAEADVEGRPGALGLTRAPGLYVKHPMSLSQFRRLKFLWQRFAFGSPSGGAAAGRAAPLGVPPGPPGPVRPRAPRAWAWGPSAAPCAPRHLDVEHFLVVRVAFPRKAYSTPTAHPTRVKISQLASEGKDPPSTPAAGSRPASGMAFSLPGPWLPWRPWYPAVAWRGPVPPRAGSAKGAASN